MNKFISAMPSSMCWPLGENSQLKVEGMRSLLKVSAKASRANRPRRLTQGPRLVDTVTSGEAVTIRAASGVFSRAISLSSAPNPLLGRHFRLQSDRKRFRNIDARRLQSALAGARERHAVEEGLNVLRGLAQSLE